jgi:hypothetical protein
MTIHARTWRLNAGRTATLAALATLGLACALSDPPTEDDAPSHGGLPMGVSASPANTQVGPVTSPTPTTEASPMPMLSRQPLGNYIEERTPRVIVDSTSRLLAARLDSIGGAATASGGLTKMPIPVARALVKSMAATLHKSRVTRVHNVAVELDSLDALLAQSPVDGRLVGRSLQRLSARSAAATPEAGVLAARVARLADLLQAEGARMAQGQ